MCIMYMYIAYIHMYICVYINFVNSLLAILVALECKYIFK